MKKEINLLRLIAAVVGVALGVAFLVAFSLNYNRIVNHGKETTAISNAETRSTAELNATVSVEPSATEVAKVTSAVATTSAADFKQIYLSYITGNAGKKFFEPLSEDLYPGSMYNGSKTVDFIDLDGDGIEECILSAQFMSDESLSYQLVYVFDTDGKDVKQVYTTKDCGDHRAQQKFAIVKVNGSYLFHLYYVDSFVLNGSVYRYNGSDTELIWSYFSALDDNSEQYYRVSDTFDFYLAFEEYIPLPDEALYLSKDEFYQKYNSYIDSECLRFPAR